MLKKFFSTLFLCSLISCSPASPDEFANESERIQKELVRQLRDVETLDDIAKRGPKIRSLSFELVELMKKADVYYKKTHQEIVPRDLPITEVLRSEMKRIYQLDGGREMIEKYQREALFLLDEYAKN